jgi:hypothetical protein
VTKNANRTGARRLRLVEGPDGALTELERLADFFMLRARELPVASASRREIEAALVRYRALVAGSVPQIG